MAQPIAILNDTSSHGGHIQIASGNFQIGGQQVVVNQDILNCPIHGPVPINATSTTVFSAGKNVVRDGDLATCGAMIIATGTVNSG